MTNENISVHEGEMKQEGPYCRVIFRATARHLAALDDNAKPINDTRDGFILIYIQRKRERERGASKLEFLQNYLDTSFSIFQLCDDKRRSRALWKKRK